MSTIPDNLMAVRKLFEEKTGLTPIELGILHYSPQGGGYHEGNDLLAAGGRLNTDYSKRESPLDRPGDNNGSGIDIGWFSVEVNGKTVDLRTLSRWVLANVHAPDAQWMREMIYSLDGKTVKRYDRLGIRSTGDSSHLTHDHFSKFRMYKGNVVRFFERFWLEMEGGSDMDLNEVGGIVPGIKNADALRDIWCWAATARGLAPVDDEGTPQPRTDDRFQDPTYQGALWEEVTGLQPGNVTQDMLNIAVKNALLDPTVLAALGPVIEANAFSAAQRAERE